MGGLKLLLVPRQGKMETVNLQEPLLQMSGMSKAMAKRIIQLLLLQETFEWNGISNKRKGQKWSTQKQSAASWEEPKGDNVSPSLPRQFGWKGASNKLGGQKWGEEKQPSSSWKNSRDYNSLGKEKQTSSSWKKEIKMRNLQGLLENTVRVTLRWILRSLCL